MSIGAFSLILSVLELLTEPQYYAAEARADMMRKGGTDAEVNDRDSKEVNDLSPPIT